MKSWRELREARKNLSEISAQEEFAKWARQQRVMDKLQAEHDKLSGERQRALLAKTVGLSLFLRVLTYALLFWILSIKLTRVGVFCQKEELFGPLAGLLALPKSQYGKLTARKCTFC